MIGQKDLITLHLIIIQRNMDVKLFSQKDVLINSLKIFLILQKLLGKNVKSSILMLSKKY